MTSELLSLKKDDVKVHVDGDTLVVEGERREEKERRGLLPLRTKLRQFYRTILIPEGSKMDQTAAQFNNAQREVVTMLIPALKAKRQEIPIQEGSKTKAR